jgi:phytol kinase
MNSYTEIQSYFGDKPFEQLSAKERFKFYCSRSWFSFLLFSLIALPTLAIFWFFWRDATALYFQDYTLATVLRYIAQDSLFFLVIGVSLGIIRRLTGMRVNFSRKIIHLLMFSYVVILAHAYNFAGDRMVFVPFGFVLLSAIALYQGKGSLIYSASIRDSEAPFEAFFLFFPLATAVITILAARAIFGPLFIVGMLICGFGDSAGEFIGIPFGRHKYQVPAFMGKPTTKSWEGSLGVWLASIIGAFIALYAFLAVPFTPALGLSIVAGLIGTIGEALSPHGLDNVSMIFLPTGFVALFL